MKEKPKNGRYKDGRFAENNTFHEKWTPSVVKKRLKRMIRRLENDESILTIHKLCNEEKLYYDWFNNMARKFKDYTEIYEMIKRIKTITEGRILEGALKRDVDSYVALFGLRTYYGRQDKQVIEQNTKTDGELKVTLRYAKREDDESEG